MIISIPSYSIFFFFNDTATTEIYTLSLHDALPISIRERSAQSARSPSCATRNAPAGVAVPGRPLVDRWIKLRERSEEHTSELQSLAYLVCRLLLEKKKKTKKNQKETKRKKI